MQPWEKLAWTVQEQHPTDPRLSMLAQEPGVDLPSVTTEAMVTPSTLKPALTAWQRGRVQAADMPELSHGAYRRCLGTLCSQRRKTRHLQRVIHCSLKSEPCGNISRYTRSFPPKMQQYLLLFLFFFFPLTASLLAGP